MFDLLYVTPWKFCGLSELCYFKSKRSLLFDGCYRPPSSTIIAHNKKFEECIETAYLSDKEIILTGASNVNAIILIESIIKIMLGPICQNVRSKVRFERT